MTLPVDKKRREFGLSIWSLAAACCILLVLSLHGHAGRHYLAAPRVELIPEPYTAFPVWKQAGVRGRVLFLFDRRLNFEAPLPAEEEEIVNGIPLDSSLRKNNYVYLAVRNNIIRKIFHIVPDSAWPEVEPVLSDNHLVRRSGDVFSMTLSVTPIYILRIKDIPVIEEPVLLLINDACWNAADQRQIISLMKDKVLSSDLIALAGNNSEQWAEEFRSYARSIQ